MTLSLVCGCTWCRMFHGNGRRAGQGPARGADRADRARRPVGLRRLPTTIPRGSSARCSGRRRSPCSRSYAVAVGPRRWPPTAPHDVDRAEQTAADNRRGGDPGPVRVSCSPAMTAPDLRHARQTWTCRRMCGRSSPATASTLLDGQTAPGRRPGVRLRRRARCSRPGAHPCGVPACGCPTCALPAEDFDGSVRRRWARWTCCAATIPPAVPEPELRTSWRGDPSLSSTALPGARSTGTGRAGRCSATCTSRWQARMRIGPHRVRETSGTSRRNRRAVCPALVTAVAIRGRTAGSLPAWPTSPPSPSSSTPHRSGSWRSSADFAAYPEWTNAVKQTEVAHVGRGRPGPSRSSFTLDAGPIKDIYTLAYDWYPDHRGVSWKLVKGQMQRAQKGSYDLVPAGGQHRG